VADGQRLAVCFGNPQELIKASIDRCVARDVVKKHIAFERWDPAFLRGFKGNRARRGARIEKEQIAALAQ